MLLAYFLQGTPIPKLFKDRSARLHVALGLVMAAALLVPLIHAPDPAYPDQSRWPTLFASLGHANNAPAVMALYQLVERVGPGFGYPLLYGLIGLAGLAFGILGIRFARFKDRLYDELGPIKYAIVMGLFLIMMGVLGKIALRLLFGIKYLIAIPAFSFNI